MVLSVQRALAPSREGDEQVESTVSGQQVCGAAGGVAALLPTRRLLLSLLAAGASRALPSPEADIIAGSPPWGPQAAGR
jgi:hypothetical protein